MLTETTSEFLHRADPDAARAVALSLAASAGVPFEALNEIRRMPADRSRSTAAWLRLALDVGERREGGVEG